MKILHGLALMSLAYAIGCEEPVDQEQERAVEDIIHHVTLNALSRQARDTTGRHRLIPPEDWPRDCPWTYQDTCKSPPPPAFNVCHIGGTWPISDSTWRPRCETIEYTYCFDQPEVILFPDAGFRPVSHVVIWETWSRCCCEPWHLIVFGASSTGSCEERNWCATDQ